MAGGLVVFALTAGLFWGQEAQKPEPTPAPGAPAAAQVPSGPHDYNISVEERERKNPIRFTDVSVARGKKVFLTQCTMCHGEKGDGTGDLAKQMNVNMPDLTKPDTLKNLTDGEVFKIIGVGNEVMPGQEKRMRDTQRWNIVNFLRSLSGAVPQKATGKELDENIIEVPQKSEP